MVWPYLCKTLVNFVCMYEGKARVTCVWKSKDLCMCSVD